MFWDKAAEYWNSIVRNLSTFRFADLIDIALVAIILYYVFKFIRDRRAGKLAVGIITILLLLFVSNLIHMRVLSYIMQNVFQIGIIAILIVFQPEFRAALEKVGGGSLKGMRSFGESKDDREKAGMIETVAQAAAEMSEKKTGALIVFERTTKLGDLILTGTVIDSQVSVPLIKNIFFNKSPLHDGALIIRDMRLYAAGCLLPLSQSQERTRDLGTRHRAALGISENSDAVVVVVSEETGVISLAAEGKLRRGFTAESLAAALNEYLVTEERGHGRFRTKLEYLMNTRSLRGAIGKIGNADGSADSKPAEPGDDKDAANSGSDRTDG